MKTDRPSPILSAFATPMDMQIVAGRQMTDRQLQVLRLLANGMENAEIAEALNLSIGTVKTHVTGAMQFLYARNRTHAAVLAVRKGLI